MYEMNSIKWHKENLNEISKYNLSLRSELIKNFKSCFESLNKTKCSLEFKKFQIRKAEEEKKVVFTDDYKKNDFDFLNSLSIKKDYTYEEIFKLIRASV